MQDKKNPYDTTLELVRASIKHDTELRKKYAIDNKFRFIQDRLYKLVEKLEAHLPPAKAAADSRFMPGDDECIIYVYLFNAHGIALKNWENMLSPKVFYEYSVNRPLYEKIEDIQALIRTKTNKALHGYLTVAVKSANILQPQSDAVVPKDIIGNTLLRIKEGSLHFGRLICFTHNGHDYMVGENGSLVKKD